MSSKPRRNPSTIPSETLPRPHNRRLSRIASTSRRMREHSSATRVSSIGVCPAASAPLIARLMPRKLSARTGMSDASAGVFTIMRVAPESACRYGRLVNQLFSACLRLGKGRHVLMKNCIDLHVPITETPRCSLPPGSEACASQRCLECDVPVRHIRD